MSNNKLLKKVYIVFICLAAAVLICLNIYQHKKIIRLSQRVNQQASATNQSTVNHLSENKWATQAPTLSENEKRNSNSEYDDLKYQLGAAQEELDMAKEQLSGEAAKKAGLKEKELESFKDYMKDPNYKNNIRQSIEAHYSPLFKKLNLSDDQLEKFKDILVNNTMAYSNFYIELQNVTASDAEEKRDEFKLRAEELKKEHEAEVIKLIGKDGFEEYEIYNETAGERSTLYQFTESVSSDFSLTEDQMEQLLNAMYEARKNVIYENIDDNYRFRSEMYDEGYIARMLDYDSRKAEAYLTAAQNILSPSQIEQFKIYLEKQHDQYESSMKMQALKYGDSEETH